MHVEEGMPGEPRLDLGMLVSRIVVGDQMDIKPRRDCPVDPVEKADELLVPVLLHALADHPAVKHIERSEQGGGAVALIIMGHGPGPSLLHRKARLGAVERLDLGLLVNRQNDGVLRRVEIEPDHVLDFLRKSWIVRQFEGCHQMRLQAMRLPDRLDARRRDAHRLCHRSQAPMGRGRRGLRLGLLDHTQDHIRRERRLARRPRLVAAQTVDAGLDIARPPAPDGRLAYAQASLDLIGADTVAGQLYDPRAPDRYYVSQGLIKGSRRNAPRGRRVPAGDLEALVEDRLLQFLTSESELFAAIETRVEDVNDCAAIITRAVDLARSWPALAAAGKRAILSALVDRVDLLRDTLEIRIVPDRLPSILEDGWVPHDRILSGNESQPTITLTVAARLQRAGMETRLLIDGAGGGARNKPDHSLCRVLAQAHRYHAMVMHNGGKTMAELAAEAGVGGSYFSRILRLSFLAPEIVKAILRDRHPVELTAKRLVNEVQLPITWQDQQVLLGTD